MSQPISGTFTLHNGGVSSRPLPYDADDATVQAAINALPVLPVFNPATESSLDTMPLDKLDEYHDSLLTCLVYLDHLPPVELQRYRDEAERVEAKLHQRGW